MNCQGNIRMMPTLTCTRPCKFPPLVSMNFNSELETELIMCLFVTTLCMKLAVLSAPHNLQVFQEVGAEGHVPQ